MFGWLRELFGGSCCSDTKRYSSEDLRRMNKLQLEKHARKFGVELDRRLNKQQLIKETLKAQVRNVRASQIRKSK